MRDVHLFRAGVVALVCGIVGGGFGLVVGELVFQAGARFGINYVALYIVSAIAFGVMLSWWIVPLENRYIWWPALGRALPNEEFALARKLYRPTPFAFCFLIGIMIGISHGANHKAISFFSGLL